MKTKHKQTLKEPPEVTRVEHRGGFRLHLWFSNGREGDVDFGDEFIGAPGRMGELADPAYFAKVFLDLEARTISWPNGLDFDPTVLYCEATGTPIKELIPGAEEFVRPKYT